MEIIPPLEIRISGEYIELNKALKYLDLVASGGEAKHEIALGHVKVDGNVETRIRRKLQPGSKVEYQGNVFFVSRTD